MRPYAALTIGLLAACTAFPPVGGESRPPEDYVGQWIGKWDNVWCVQFTIRQDQTTKNIAVLYKWEENPGQPLHIAQASGRLAGNQLRIGDLIEMSISARSPDEAVAYGRFPVPRTAVLTRNAAQSCDTGRLGPPERIFKKGFSLVPFPETGWVVLKQGSNELAMGKFGKDPEESVVIRAVLFRLPAFGTNQEFVRLIKEHQVKGTNPQRLKTIKHEVVAHPKNGTDCARSHMVAEDHGAANRAGKTGVMLQEVSTLACAHPKQKDIGISVSYSQRYWPGRGDPEFLEKATSVLKSVEFADL